MKSSLTPKELAQAIGVSESSLKRWVDDGLLQAARTPGGHRRIALPEAIRFIRATQATVVRPDLLGVSDLEVPAPGAAAIPEDEALFQALCADDHLHARNMIVTAFLQGQSVAALGDGMIRAALARIGELWPHDHDAIVMEHRAVDTCSQSLHLIRSLLPTPAGDAPGAVGGAPAGDPYLLPSLMAATALQEIGFRELNLGPETPCGTLQCAINRYRPRLVWMAIKVPIDPERLTTKVTIVTDCLAASGGILVIGGRGVCDVAVPDLPNLYIARSMADLVAVAGTLLIDRPTPEPVTS